MNKTPKKTKSAKAAKQQVKARDLKPRKNPKGGHNYYTAKQIGN